MTLRQIGPFLLIVLLVLAVQATMALQGVTPVLQGRLSDTDSYMWLLQAEDLVHGKSWFDHSVPRMNAPFGDTLNWSRPTDVVILALALPFRPFMEWREAIFWGGALMAPLLHIALGFALVWAFAPLVKREARPLLMLMMLIQPILIAYTMAGRPDHHALILISDTLFLGLCTRMLLGANPFKTGALAGLVMAFGIWAAVESQFVLVLMAALFGLIWVVKGGQNLLDFLVAQGIALLLGLTVALFIERGPEMFIEAAQDKISWVYILLAAGKLTVWLLLREREGATPLGRLAALAMAGIAGLVVIAVIHPRALLGPSANIDPEVMRKFFMNIREMSPLWPKTLEEFNTLLLMLGASFWGLLLWAILWTKGKIQRPYLPNLPLLVAAIAFTIAALLHARFGMFAAPLGAGFLVIALEALNIDAYKNAARRILTRVGILLAPFLIAILGVAIIPQPQSEALEKDAKKCAISELAPELAKLPTGTIMASLNYGPELLYFTPHSVVAGPYHRNRDGILDSFTFFTTKNPNAAEAIARHRRLEYVLLCERDLSDPKLSKDYFGVKLLKGRTPAWLSPIKLPKDSSFRLYRVLN